jgi:hypothetical protein
MRCFNVIQYCLEDATACNIRSIHIQQGKWSMSLLQSICHCRVNMQVMLEAFVAGEHQAAERFDSYAPCSAESGAGLSVAAFEWLVVGLLCISTPVMLWRKWGMRTLLPL